MFKKLIPLIIVLLLSCAISAVAQNRSAIKGQVRDSLNKTPVEFATVAVLNARDTLSPLIAYTLTDKQGSFALHNLPENLPLKVLISFVAYQPYRKFLMLKKNETVDLGIIDVSPKQLKEIVVHGERMPVVVRKDTIIFDAEAFKVRPNAVVEDLLKKLPGVEVDNAGEITVMGKKVNKVLLDGHEFFSSDKRIATRNLDADMVSKIEVYDDRENDPDHVIPESQVGKIINLKFKKALKKSIFGKVYGGAGTHDHYQAGGLFNMFRDTLQVSLLGTSNNLNNTGFSYDDLMVNGGLNRGGSETFGRNFGGFRNTDGKQNLITSGANINTDYGKKLKINLAYLYTRNQTEYNSQTFSQQLLNDTTLYTNSATSRTYVTGNHNLSANIAWHPDNFTQLNYTPQLTIANNNNVNAGTSNSFTNFINPVNNRSNNSTSDGGNFSFGQSLSYNRKLKKKGSSLGISHNFQYSPSRGNYYENSDLTSYLSSLSSFSIRRQNENRNKGTSTGINATYRYPFSKKITGDVTLSSDYNSQLNRTSAFDFDPLTHAYTSFLAATSSDLTRNKWTESINPGLTFTLPKSLMLTAHFVTQFQQVHNIFKRNVPDLYQNYVFFLPAVSLNMNNISLNYSRTAQLPNIGDIIPYKVVFSPLYTVTGNPDLKPTIRNNVSLFYFGYKFQQGINYSINANLSAEENSIFRQRTINTELVETSMPVNKDGRYNYSLSAYFTKSFKKRQNIQFRTSTQVNFYGNRDFFVLNGQQGHQNNNTLRFSENLSLNWRDKIIIEPDYAVSQTYTTYKDVNYSNQHNITHTLNTKFSFFLPPKFNVDGNYTFMHNSLVASGFQKNSNLLSMSIAHQFLKKDRGEIKLSCYDIFNQNINVWHIVYQNTITDQQSEIIKRYFMLTFQFKFNKSTLKEPETGPNRK